MSARDDQPMHEPFSWLMPSIRGSKDAEFVVRVRNISIGVETTLQIIRNDTLDRDADRPTMFSPNDMEGLMFLATESLAMLAEQAERMIDSLNDGAPKGDQP